MHEVKEHLEKLEKFQTEAICRMCEIKEDIHAVSVVSDIVKDVADAMEKESKARYYKCLTDQLCEEKEAGRHGWDDVEFEFDGEMGYRSTAPRSHRGRGMHHGVMGYDNWKYASGRYAPKGHGHYVGHSGYTPDGMPIIGGEMDDYFDRMELYDPTRVSMMPMGYNSSNPMQQHPMSQYGTHYDNYLMSKKHYTETKDDRDKSEMSHHAKEHMRGIEYTLKDMWQNADPSLRKELKTQMETLVSEMK